MTTSQTIGPTTGIDGAGRIVEGICVPYDEISYLTPNPHGERVLKGAFAAAGQTGPVFLFRGHDHQHPLGKAVSFTDEPYGLVGRFVVRESPAGDEVLEDVRDGYLPAMSVGFKPMQVRRGAQGETEVVEGMLKEVSLLPVGAYDGAKVLALRAAAEPSAKLPPPIATIPHSHEPEVPAPPKLDWHVPGHLRHLVDLDDDGHLRDTSAATIAKRAPYVARRPAPAAEAMPLDWSGVRADLRALFGVTDAEALPRPGRQRLRPLRPAAEQDQQVAV